MKHLSFLLSEPNGWGKFVHKNCAPCAAKSGHEEAKQSTETAHEEMDSCKKEVEKDLKCAATGMELNALVEGENTKEKGRNKRLREEFKTIAAELNGQQFQNAEGKWITVVVPPKKIGMRNKIEVYESNTKEGLAQKKQVFTLGIGRVVEKNYSRESKSRTKISARGLLARFKKNSANKTKSETIKTNQDANLKDAEIKHAKNSFWKKNRMENGKKKEVTKFKNESATEALFAELEALCKE